MKDEEIAAIASYVRHSFGNLKENPITPAEVKSLRPEINKRKFMPWSPQELEAAGK
jgi:mono/diheme cytochrome c family protein